MIKVKNDIKLVRKLKKFYSIQNHVLKKINLLFIINRINIFLTLNKIQISLIKSNFPKTKFYQKNL